MKHRSRITVPLLLLCAALLSGCQTNSNDTPADVTTPEQSVTTPQESTYASDKITETNSPVEPEQIPQPPKEYRELLALRNKVAQYAEQNGEDESILLDYSEAFAEACAKACETDNLDLVKALLHTIKVEDDKLETDNHLKLFNEKIGHARSGYALMDLNGDEKDELILMTENHDLIAVCMIQNGEYTFPQPEHFANHKKYDATIASDGTIYYCWHYNGDYYGQEYVRLNAEGTWDQVFAIRHTYRDENYNPYIPCDDVEYLESVHLFYMQINGGEWRELTWEEYDTTCPYIAIDLSDFQRANKKIVFIPFE